MNRRILAAALGVFASFAAQAADGPPAFPVNDVAETFFGTVVHDPYRALENKTAPEVVAWMRAQSDHARATLDKIPGRAALVERMLEVDGSVAARVTGVQRETAGRWFYERRGATENQYKLLMRSGLQGAEKLLVDPEALEKQLGKPHAINYFTPAPGGGRVAYGLSVQGSEDAQLYVQDTASGAPVAGPISRAKYGGVSWSRDGRAMTFIRLQEMKPGMPEQERYQRAQVLLWQPGQPIESASEVFGIGTPGAEIDPAATPVVTLTGDGRWALGLVINGTQREFGLYIAPAASLLAGKPVWKRVFGPEAQVVGMAYFSNHVYLRAHKVSPRYEVVALDLARPDIANAEVVMAGGDQVITDLATAADGLYIETRDGNANRLYAKAWARGAKVAEVKLPLLGSFALSDPESGASSGDPRLSGVVIELQGYTRARQIYHVTAKGGARNTALQPQGPFDVRGDLVATEVKVKSHDGALVPMSIVHKKGLKLDGRNPTLLYGYASYGITEEPVFSTTRLAFIDAGGVLAVANPRGSSVYGEDWYRAGWQATKPNTWRDFISCAEWLVTQGYASKPTLGIFGGSAGGILVGRAMTERPDLFGAVVSSVGALDMVRAELTANGVPNIPEFGTRSTEAGFKSLLAMSSYHQIQDGVKYPAVLLTHGVNDPRVEPWMSTKTGARLQAASTSGKPVLLRLDWDAGHGIGNTKRQQFEERADVYAFLLWQLGAAAYQPK